MGTSFSAIRDVNGDSIDDIATGSPNASPLGRSNAGVINIIYGKQGGYNSPIDTANLLSSQGYKMLGPIQYASLGISVSSAGDFDNDGRTDVMAAVSSNPVDTSLDAVYFLYSKQGGYSTDVDLASLTSSQGLIVYGAQNEAITKCSLAGNAIGDSHLDYLIVTYSDAYVLDGGKLMQFANLSGSNGTSSSPQVAQVLLPRPLLLLLVLLLVYLRAQQEVQLRLAHLVQQQSKFLKAFMITI